MHLPPGWYWQYYVISYTYPSQLTQPSVGVQCAPTSSAVISLALMTLQFGSGRDFVALRKTSADPLLCCIAIMGVNNSEIQQ